MHGIDVGDMLQRNKLRVDTVVDKQSCKYVDFLGNNEEYEEFRFCCPVCLRYFNNILESSCCGNYICRFCIHDMAKQAKLKENYVIKCAHCLTDDFELRDVDLYGEAREYTDTPRNLRRDQQPSFTINPAYPMDSASTPGHKTTGPPTLSKDKLHDLRNTIHSVEVTNKRSLRLRNPVK